MANVSKYPSSDDDDDDDDDQRLTVEEWLNSSKEEKAFEEETFRQLHERFKRPGEFKYQPTKEEEEDKESKQIYDRHEVVEVHPFQHPYQVWKEEGNKKAEEIKQGGESARNVRKQDEFLQQDNAEWVNDTMTISSDVASDDGVDEENLLDFMERVERLCHKCYLCNQVPCEWFNYAAEVNAYARKFEKEKIHLLNESTISIAMKTRRYQVYKFLEKLRTNGTKRGKGKCVPFPLCVEREVRNLFPDPKEKYTGFKKK